MKEQAEIFKALGDPVRLEIIKLLLGKELCVCDILSVFKVSQPTISHHLRALKYAGLVNDRRDGKWIYYSLVPETFAQVSALLQEFAEKSVIKEQCRICEPGVQNNCEGFKKLL
ncbi:arsr-type transcription regulator hth motif [Lucifera butyrica]|uniref:Arsr-type transcription regulator hth motif n=1 Tax=Lucifera butyrica TaxID=1351585 RepID=A0A498R9U4_9FIRM|nr:metalloregulator ArsR/SmtB family transcription factor [Lucifera butyrica]VBB07727.1 arsr-type transcription regulator hth motif [Lucifera butyrica]